MCINMSDEDTTPKRRGPGRPPKNKPKERIERLGIVAEPSNLGKVHDHDVHTIELMYENPQMFKKIFGLFKSYNVKQIHTVFDSDRLYMYSKDFNGNVIIQAEIIGKMMNRYYVEQCDKIWEFSLDTAQFYKIFQGIGKEFTRIVFVTIQRHQRNKIWMMFLDEHNNTSSYEIELNDPKNDKLTLSEVNALFAMKTDYPVSFELDFKFLKNKISELSNTSKKIEIQQDLVRPGSNIYFTCTTSDNKVKNTSPLQNPGKINLINTYDGDIFTAPLFTNHIKPFSNSIISDTVKIYADDKRDIIFISDLDLDDNDTTKGKKINSEKGYIKIASKLSCSDDTPLHSK